MPPLTVLQIKTKIKELDRIKDLKVEDFATEEGWAYILVNEFGDKLKSTQLRKFFAGIKNAHLQAKKTTNWQANQPLLPEVRSKLLLMMPTLAYAKARKLVPGDFYEIVRDCLSQNRLKDNGDLEKLSQFMEAIVAYHKFVTNE